VFEWDSERRRLKAFILDAYRRYVAYDCALRAGSLAYYALLCTFPLLLFLVFLGTQVLASQDARTSLELAISQLTPQTADIISSAVEQSIQARGGELIGVIGALGLLWSASAVFGVLSSTMNMIWEVSPRPFWRRRLMALLAVSAISGLFVISLLMSVIGVLRDLLALFPSWRWVNPLVSLMVSVALFWLIYRSLPNRRVDARAALIGGGLAAGLWQLAKAGFAWYLGSGWARYGLVYGSLTSLVVLIIWMYLSAWILLTGGVVVAALERVYWPATDVQAADDFPG
jgi:membrane protein